MVLEDLARLGEGARVEVGRAVALPLVAHAAVDQLGLRLLAHVPVRAVQAQKVAKSADLVDLVDHEALVVDLDAVDHELDHLGELVVHDELRAIEGDSRLDHPRAVDDAGPCQRHRQSGEGLLVTALGVTEFGSPYAPAM